MLTKKLTIINKLGLHARAAMQLTNHAGRFQSKITLKFSHQEVDAKDILNVMSLGASKGSELELIVSGEDEKEAMADLEKLIHEKFGEEE